MTTRKRQATKTLEKPRAKKPANLSNQTLHAFFSPRQTQISDAAHKKAPVDGEAGVPAGSVKDIIVARPSAALSDEQQRILRMVLDEGRNIFFTGSAGPLPRYLVPTYLVTKRHSGTGKSLLLREIIKALKQRYAKTPDCLAICASTGMAAQNIGGVYLACS